MQLPTKERVKYLSGFAMKLISPVTRTSLMRWMQIAFPGCKRKNRWHTIQKVIFISGISATETGIFLVWGFRVAELMFRSLVTHTLTLQTEAVCVGLSVWSWAPGTPGGSGQSPTRMTRWPRTPRTPRCPITVPRSPTQPSRSPAASGCSPLWARHFCNFQLFFFFLHEICI